MRFLLVPPWDAPGRARVCSPRSAPVADRRAAAGVEDAEQPQLRRAGVLRAVHLAARKERAAAGPDRGRGATRPEPALAGEEAQDLLVLVEVVGRAAGRDR